MSRLGISTALRKFISASNAAQKARARSVLIRNNSGICKGKGPEYQLINVDVNKNTSIATVEIEESQMYRTIERYVTQNYQKYPIYSNWKYKSKTIIKKIRIKNSDLENLCNNQDELVRRFAFDIISDMDDEDLYPSWYLKTMIKNESDEVKKSLSNKLAFFVDENKRLIKSDNNNINTIKISLHEKTEMLDALKYKNNILQKRLARLEAKKPSIILAIITFSIYYFLTSKKDCKESKEKLNRQKKKSFFTIKTL